MMSGQVVPNVNNCVPYSNTWADLTVRLKDFNSQATDMQYICCRVVLICVMQGDYAAVQIYLHNVVSVGHKAYILRPFLTLTFVFSSSFYSVYRLSLNISHWTDVVAGFALGVLLAVYLVSCHDEYVEFTITHPPHHCSNTLCSRN